MLKRSIGHTVVESTRDSTTIEEGSQVLTYESGVHGMTWDEIIICHTPFENTFNDFSFLEAVEEILGEQTGERFEGGVAGMNGFW